MTETKNDLCTLEEWLHDLETTDAEQGEGLLHNEGAFCCLGRACEISDSATRSRFGYTINGGDWDSYTINGHVWDTRIPQQSWMNQDQQSACVSANDILGWSLKQIALWWRETGGAWKDDDSARTVPDFVQPS